MRHLLLIALVAFCTTIAAQLPDYVPPSQLDAWFSLDGDGADESGNGNQVEALGATLDTDRFGNPSSCFLLDGDGDYLTFGTSLGNVQDFTAAYWMETTETTGYNLLLNKDCDGCEYTTGDWGFITSNGNSGILSFSLSNSNGGFYEDIGFVADGDWHHVVVTRNATTGAVHFYLDGESVEEHLGPTGSVTNGNALHFGLQQPYNPAYYEGRVDDLGMWSRVLSGEEILGLYQSAPPVFGCTDSSACNFMPEANLDDGSCIDCALFEERCGPGTMWDESVQLCVVANPSDTDFDGCVSMTDLLDLLTVFGTCNEVPWSCGDPLEYQGYDYETVQIGEQCWFAENLRVESFRDGESITTTETVSSWLASTSPHWAIYGQGNGIDGQGCIHSSQLINACNEDESLTHYGRLYNGYAIIIENRLCPGDWHIPTIEEFGILDSAIGQESQFYSVGSGFNALPGGSFPEGSVDASFAGEFGVWGTSTTSEFVDDFMGIGISQFYDQVQLWSIPLWTGVSVRCIKDSE